MSEATALPVLDVQDLVTEFSTEHGQVRAVDGVSFSVPRGKTMGIVGESGCGKSVTAMSILRLIASPPGKITGGKVMYHGKAGSQDLRTLTEPEMREIRGNRIAMIFQEPMTALNPVMTVGDQVGEALRLHQKMSRKDSLATAIELFKKVGIPGPDERVDQYPHQLSGGMRQRVMIAMALACNPDLLIADEPTTALDVTIQAQILELLRSLQAELGMSILLITHDLGVVAETCDQVTVMYAGRIVESASTTELFAKPQHPYTMGLLKSVPSYKPADGAATHKQHLDEIPGMVPPLWALPVGCKFQDRCPYVAEKCRASEPPLLTVNGSQVRCYFPEGKAAFEVSHLGVA